MIAPIFWDKYGIIYPTPKRLYLGFNWSNSLSPSVKRSINTPSVFTLFFHQKKYFNMSSAAKQATRVSPRTMVIYTDFANKLGMDKPTKAEFIQDLQNLKVERLKLEALLNLPLNDATTKVHLRYEGGKNAHYLRVFGNVCPETGAFLPVSFKRYGTRAAYIQAVTHND